METKQTPLTDNAMTGTLPQTGYLANTYVPMQQNARLYNKEEAMTRGTLFPGLDLPFQNRVNTKDFAKTPDSEMSALGFAIHELGLYLDVHPNDNEAMELFDTYVKLMDDAKKTYNATEKPLVMATPTNGTYNWIKEPWPWEKTTATGKKEG